MLLTSLTPPLAAALLLVIGAAIGYLPTRKLITVHEARHDLKQGSAGFLRSVAGWSVIAFWLMGVWFCATIIGDWATYGDLNAALERSMLRLRVLIEIAAALANSD